MFKDYWFVTIRRFSLIALFCLVGACSATLRAQTSNEPLPLNAGFMEETPASAVVGISGRVYTSEGRGVRNARVVLIDRMGISRTVNTNSYGCYSFYDVQAGETYVLTVTSKQYRFAAQMLLLNDETTDFDFIASE